MNLQTADCVPKLGAENISLSVDHGSGAALKVSLEIVDRWEYWLGNGTHWHILTGTRAAPNDVHRGLPTRDTPRWVHFVLTFNQTYGLVNPRVSSSLLFPLSPLRWDPFP